ncbi:MAG TPA: pro-sigmaK processing inhibitor BofA family protein [Candidatus Flavonifractor intestinipullorum]|uniref:Pro-sigmaK processing inhibitor BofA family protein n=1 Tax=Candidatus Flavonifractor intestinipullorum TaxID=2838587 RepID=A0A9D2S586_9FIRM|nr:pro-sigmaK processing inhibitor BofA family protein [Candidatus Flavonifractor intestinipullorum]
MEAWLEKLPLVLTGGMVLIALLTARRAVAKGLRLAARTGVGLAVLALLSPAGGALGIHLGVNLFNALVLGVLGAPGFGLLLMMNWALAGP